MKKFNSKIKVIAEAGVNHNGSLNKAFKLVDIARNAGADYVKFQLFKADKLVTKSAIKAKYQEINLNNKSSSQFQMLQKLELSENSHLKLLNYCKKKKIGFMSTAFDEESAAFLNKLGMTIFKVPSGEITNYFLLKKIGSFKKEVLLSTGMSNISEIQDAVKVLLSSGTKLSQITILHCNTEYPTPMSDVNLNSLLYLKSKFNTNFGLSDHSLSTEVPSYAVAMGATVIEKHFTINRQLSGPDHKASLTPLELNKMIQKIRNVSIFLGYYDKKPSISEKKNIKIARKSIVASRSIKLNEKFSLSNLTAKRPGSGISPMQFPKILGKKSNKNYKKDDLISLKLIK